MNLPKNSCSFRISIHEDVGGPAILLSVKSQIERTSLEGYCQDNVPPSFETFIRQKCRCLLQSSA